MDLRQPTTAVNSFVSQILHVKSLYHLGVIILDVKVEDRLVVNIFAIKFSVN